MKKIFRCLSVLLLSAVFSVGCAGGPNGSAPDREQEEMPVGYWHDTQNFGLHVSQDGTIMLGGVPFYEAGVNCYNLCNQCFSDGFSAEKAKRSLNVLADYGIKVVRFNCGDYTALNYFTEHKAQYLRLLGEIAAEAESLEMGLIPSFFWLYHAVPDYFDEPIRAWGRGDSETVKFLRTFTKTVVDALKDYKSVFAWEFGNEFNLSCDLPNAFEHMPALPAGSKRENRTEEDRLSATDVEFALKEFEKTVSVADFAGRMITSGNATLRPSQYNQLACGNWEQDSVWEFQKITSLFAPAGVDAVSEHVYFTAQKTFGKELSLKEYLQYATANAKALKKAYFIGEWGGGAGNSYEYYSGIGNAFVDAGVQLVLLWNFNATEGSVEYSFSAETERGQMLLRIVSEMNARYDEEYETD